MKNDCTFFVVLKWESAIAQNYFYTGYTNGPDTGICLPYYSVIAKE
jgi:hypothetical protein